MKKKITTKKPVKKESKQDKEIKMLLSSLHEMNDEIVVLKKMRLAQDNEVTRLSRLVDSKTHTTETLRLNYDNKIEIMQNEINWLRAMVEKAIDAGK